MSPTTHVAPRVRQTRRAASQSLWKRIYQHRTLYLLFAPVLIYYLVMRYWPIGLAWIVAFKDLKLGSGVWNSPWVGLENFQTIFSDPQISRVLRNTIEISLLRLLFGFVPPIILAIMFHDLATPWFRRWSQTFVYLPHFFSWVIVYGLVFAFFSTGSGFVNNVIAALGFERFNFLLDEGWFRPLLIGSGIWKELGWGTIIYLGALATTDPQLYEAATIDGAGPLQRIRYITFPSLLPVITFVLCINLGFILFAGGEQVLLFYSPALYKVADVIDTWVYREGIGSFQFSVGTAMGLIQSLLGMVLILVCNALAKRYTDRGIW